MNSSHENTNRITPSYITRNVNITPRLEHRYSEVCSSRDNVLHVPHPVEAVRGSTKFSRILNLVRWHRERGGKCVVVLKDSSLVSSLSTWLTSHRVGNVVSMSPESIDTLNRCDHTCVLLSTSDDESSDSLPPLMDVTALLFVDFENMNYTESSTYHAVTKSPWRSLVVYRLVSVLGNVAEKSPSKSSKKGKRRKKASKGTVAKVKTMTSPLKKSSVFPEHRDWWSENVLDAACECVEMCEIINTPPSSSSSDSILKSESEISKAWTAIAGADEAPSRGRKRKAPSKSDGDISANEVLSLSLRLTVVNNNDDDDDDDDENIVTVGSRSEHKKNVFVVQDDDVTEIMKHRTHKSLLANRLTYDVPPVLSTIKTFDGVPVKVILNDAERHGEKETSDWKRQMQYGIQREMFKQKQGVVAGQVAKMPFRSETINEWAHSNRSAPSEMSMIGDRWDPDMYAPPHPNQVTMRDEMKHQLNEKEAGPSLMVVYRFEPRKHNVDPKIFDSMRRAIRGGDRDFLRTAVGDQTDSRKSNTQKRVEAQKRRELRVKPMKKTNASYITVNRRNKPWYVKKDLTNIPIPWSNQEDKILMSAVARFGFNWSIVEKRLCGAGDHPRHLRGKKECFLRYVELRDRAKMNGSNHKFFLDSEFSEIPKPPSLEFRDEDNDKDENNIIRRQYPQSTSFRRTNRRVYRSILESSGLFQKPLDPILERYATNNNVDISKEHPSHQMAVSDAKSVAKEIKNANPSMIIDARNERKRQAERAQIARRNTARLQQTGSNGVVAPSSSSFVKKSSAPAAVKSQKAVPEVGGEARKKKENNNAAKST